MSDAGGGPSRSQVTRAGSNLRKISRGELPEDLLEANLEVIAQHRRAHAQPMLTANVAMRRYAEQIGIEAKVTQRLKRMQTIIEKVTMRENTMNLANMRDIGGVRVVVTTLSDLRALQSLIESKREGVTTVDYVANPRSSGYRAVHLICSFGREPRPVEIQLRTEPMHRWAEMVEEVSSIVGANRKQDGDTPFHRWALMYSQILEAEELGKPRPVTDHDWKTAWRQMLSEGVADDEER